MLSGFKVNSPVEIAGEFFCLGFLLNCYVDEWRYGL
jgi:hypothetical protein